MLRDVCGFSQMPWVAKQRTLISKARATMGLLTLEKNNRLRPRGGKGYGMFVSKDQGLKLLRVELRAGEGSIQALPDVQAQRLSSVADTGVEDQNRQKTTWTNPSLALKPGSSPAPHWPAAPPPPRTFPTGAKRLDPL